MCQGQESSISATMGGMQVWHEGLPTDQPLWGFMEISGWMVEAKYLIPKGEAVFCDVVYGVMFVSLNACYSVTSHALHFTSLLCESYRYSSL